MGLDERWPPLRHRYERPRRAALTRGGLPSQVVDLAARTGILLLTEATHAELVEVLHRPRLQKYLTDEGREAILAQVIGAAAFVVVEEPIAAYRDPTTNSLRLP
jgi:predicted nucleic acid-binding protein